MHLLLYTAHRSLCGHRWKESSLRAGLVLFTWLPLPAVSHQKAITARRQSVLSAAVCAEDAGCRDAYDGASSPGNRTRCLPGTHRAQGRRMPADSERNRKVARGIAEVAPPPRVVSGNPVLRQQWKMHLLGTGVLEGCGMICRTSASEASVPWRWPWLQDTPETEVHVPVTLSPGG